ncbi:DUF4262 domain-containing protein [Marinomonas sp. PE14-40]|uniref:DUF4262 domain-containing protein n=1 Tax=Marinomonas sp. PE14-40 TaxID=3060621 RepID=UPI003F67F891
MSQENVPQEKVSKESGLKAAVFMESMPTGFVAPPAETQQDSLILEQIKKVGWYNLHIGQEDDQAAFSFSIGHFQQHNHPELILVGLPAEVANQLLNIAVVKIVGAKERLEPYKKYDDFTEGLAVAFIPVELDFYRDYLGYANWYYGDLPKPYPVLQMVWPDREGYFPWEAKFDTSFKQAQPLLGFGPNKP